VDNPWTTLRSEVKYKNPWLRLREDVVIRPDGSQGIYSVVEIRPSVGVVAIDETGRIALVTQWRYTHNKVSIEIPTGGSLSDDSSILVAAQRELLEEAGLAADSWRSLGRIDNSNGATTDVAHLYLATGLTAGPSHQDAEESVELSWHHYFDVVRMVMAGEITESVSVAGILKTEYLRLHGELELPN